MANGSDTRPPMGGGVDLKTMVVVVIALIGGLGGLWIRSGDRTVDDLKSSNFRQWERISENNNRLQQYGVELRQAQRELEDHETRLRAIERELKHSH